MKRSEFDIHKHCGKCKGPLEEHDEIHFGVDCPREEVPFEGDQVEFCSYCVWSWQYKLLRKEGVSVGVTRGLPTGRRCDKHGKTRPFIKVWTVSSVEEKR